MPTIARPAALVLLLLGLVMACGGSDEAASATTASAVTTEASALASTSSAPPTTVPTSLTDAELEGCLIQGPEPFGNVYETLSGRRFYQDYLDEVRPGWRDSGWGATVEALRNDPIIVQVCHAVYESTRCC